MALLKRKRIYFSIFWTVLVCSFIFFAIVLIAYANGYHLNLKNFHLQKTGMIIVQGNLSSVNVSINGQNRQTNLPCRFSRLIPGRYEIKVSKQNYQTWSKIVNVTGGEAITFDNITLFLNSITPAPLTTNSSAIDKINNNYQSQSTDINKKDNELRYKNQLITRFSQPILAAIYDSGDNRFYFQLGNEMRTIDYDGSNNILLFTLTDPNPVNIFLNNNNLIYVFDNQIYQATIR